MNTLDRPVGARDLLRLAIPSAAFVVLTNAYRLVDQYWIQGVSTEAQAAVGSSIFVLLIFFAGGELIAAGLGPLVARATGAGNDEERRRVLGCAERVSAETTSVEPLRREIPGSASRTKPDLTASPH